MPFTSMSRTMVVACIYAISRDLRLACLEFAKGWTVGAVLSQFSRQIRKLIRLEPTFKSRSPWETRENPLSWSNCNEDITGR